MKKLKLKAIELGNAKVLTRSQLRNVLGGVFETTTAAPCLGTYFYTGSNGCGYTTCKGWAANGVDCMCSTTITTAPPCGYA